MDETHDDMTSYQRWEHGMIEDIGHDTDSIIKMLGSEKMGESFDTGALMGMLANKGVDPGIIAMLNDCKEKGAWGGDGGMLVILFLILIMGFGGGSGFFGGGNRDVAGVDRTVVNEANYSRMLDAIGGNREAISQLAQTLNCTQGQTTAALAGVDKQIQAEDGAGAPQICDDSGGGQAHQEGLSAGETDAEDAGNRLRSLNIGFRLYTPKNSIILIRGPLTRMS